MSLLANALITLARKDPGAVFEALDGAIKGGVADRSFDADEGADITARGIDHYGPMMQVGVFLPQSIKVYHADFYQAAVVEGLYENGGRMIAVPDLGFGVVRLPLGYIDSYRLHLVQK